MRRWSRPCVCLTVGLLGDALARAAEATSYEALVRERLCAPIGLEDTWIEPPPGVREQLLVGRTRRGRTAPALRDAMPAGGSVRATTSDLLRVLGAAVDGDPFFASAATRRAALGRGIWIGLGWLIMERKEKPPAVWHNGGTWGFRSFAAYVPDAGLAVAVLTNTFRGVDRLGWKLVGAASR